MATFRIFFGPLPPITGTLAATESGEDTVAITGTVEALAAAAPAGSGKRKAWRDPLRHNEVERFAPFKPRTPTLAPVRGRMHVYEGSASDTVRMVGRVLVSGQMAITESEAPDTVAFRGIVRHSRAALAQGVLRVLFDIDEAA